MDDKLAQVDDKQAQAFLEADKLTQEDDKLAQAFLEADKQV